jgi:CBS domain-containing protein
VKVGELCVRRVEVAEPGESARDAARRMIEAGAGSLVVVDQLRRPLGIVTDRDLMARCLVAARDAARTRVADVMSAPAVWARESLPAGDAALEMARLRVRRLPVVDDRDRLVGILALDDLLAASLDAASPEAQALRANL